MHRYGILLILRPPQTLAVIGNSLVHLDIERDVTDYFLLGVIAVISVCCRAEMNILVIQIFVSKYSIQICFQQLADRFKVHL